MADQTSDASSASEGEVEGRWEVSDTVVTRPEVTGPGNVERPRPRPVCGNGVLDMGEACDDGGAIPGDGCDETCQRDPAYALFSLIPVAASGPCQIDGNRANLGSGGRVWIEIYFVRWGPARPKAWQATLDPTGYSSGYGEPLTPAVEPCADTAECESAFGRGSECQKACVGGSNDGNRCYGDSNCPGGTCEGSFCEAGFQTTARPDFLFQPPAVSAVDLFTPWYRWGSTPLGDCMEDLGLTYYGGTLVLDVPALAAGTYEISLALEDDQTFMESCDHSLVPLADPIPALITVGNVQ